MNENYVYVLCEVNYDYECGGRSINAVIDDGVPIVISKRDDDETTLNANQFWMPVRVE